MLKDEFERIMGLFNACIEGRSFNVEMIFKEALDFFEQVTEVLREGSPEDKHAALKMMSEMYQQMIATSQKLAKDSGLSEEQIAKVAENPSNFSPEQWKTMQASKARMASLTNDLLKALESIAPQGKTPQKEQLDKKPSPKKLGNARSSKNKKKGKSDWLRS